ncbi:uncharacterized protein LOC107006879 [Solanum pennellii]|uniref:Uncharacterized protein LOC107006879 n=1 Tax=Solanum pennellii TaxID=28526 RepID=A0ABM1FS09_SOLPN|nr:uncharacterized protein LOC107006879 [Solanum pennellii]
MKTFGFSVLFLMMGITAFLSFFCFNTGGMSFKWQNTDTTMTIKNRKLQENGYGPSINEDDSSKLGLEDYRPIDPVPSSKASVKPGPIEHGTPLMPYIPKPSPPPISTIDGLP